MKLPLLERVIRLVSWPPVPHQPIPLSMLGPAYQCAACDVTWHGNTVCFVCGQPPSLPERTTA